MSTCMPHSPPAAVQLRVRLPGPAPAAVASAVAGAAPPRAGGVYA